MKMIQIIAVVAFFVSAALVVNYGPGMALKPVSTTKKTEELDLFQAPSKQTVHKLEVSINASFQP